MSRLTRLGAAVATALLLLPLTGCGSTQTFILTDLEGFGSDSQLPEFAALGAWNLQYSYDCTGHGATGGFAITVYNHDDDSLIEENPDTIDTGAKTGQKSTDKVVHYHHACSCYMAVSSGCTWRVQVRVQQ